MCNFLVSLALQPKAYAADAVLQFFRTLICALHVDISERMNNFANFTCLVPRCETKQLSGIHQACSIKCVYNKMLIAWCALLVFTLTSIGVSSRLQCHAVSTVCSVITWFMQAQRYLHCCCCGHRLLSELWSTGQCCSSSVVAP